MIKRLFDIIFSLTSIVLLLPLIIIISILIKCDKSGKIFFHQIRVGKNGKCFKLIKFRTMRDDKLFYNTQITIAGDRRITKIGSFLRKYKLDELPQLYNVLIGDMSIVGPRPEVLKYVNSYSKEQREVLKLIPGITDPASLIFFDESNLLATKINSELYYVNECIPVKIKINLNYANNSNIITDIIVIYNTIIAIFRFKSN